MAQALLVLPSQTPDIEVKTFELLETEQNLKSLELKSPQAAVYKTRDLIGIESPTATVWNKAGNPTLLSGKQGIIDSKSGNVQMVGTTQIEAQNGMIFRTDSMTFLSEAKKISTDNAVEGISKTANAQSPSLRIAGTGLNVDIRTQSYTILSNVQARQAHSQDFFAITSHSASIFPINNKAQFIGQAEVRSKKMQLKGDEALLILASGARETRVEGIEMSSGQNESNVLAKIEDFVIHSQGFRASFNAKGELLESRAMGSVNAVSPSGVKMAAQSLKLIPGRDGFVVNLEQGVKITIDDRIATCEEAVYYPNTGNIVLKKFASVIRQDQELNGDVISLSTKNSEVVVEKASGTLNPARKKK